MAKHKVANLNLTPTSVLGDKEFTAIGKMVVAFHSLEHQLLSILTAAGVGTKKNQKHLTFGSCRELIEKSVLPNIRGEKLRSELSDLLAEAKAINGARNRIVHAVIGKNDGEPDVMVVLNSSIKPDSKMYASVHHVSVPEIEKLARNISVLHGRFHGWYLKVYCAHAFE